MRSEHTSSHHLKEKIKHEIEVYLMYSFFLALLFFTFTVYERVLLGGDNSLIPYGFCIINALILAKIVMIGEAIHIGKHFHNKPLIFPVLFKTIMFCLLVLVFTIVERFIEGFIHGKTILEINTQFKNADFNLAFAKICVMFFVFIFFFSVLETSRVLGDNKLFTMFFINPNK